MGDNKVLKLVYTFFLGVLLAIFVGVGIGTFYKSPAAPHFPVELNGYGKEQCMTEEQVAKQREYDRKLEKYQEQMKPYNRNVSIISLAAGVVFLTLSLIFEKRIKIIADGIMLGGLFLLIYSTGRGFAAEDSKYVFVTVSVGLVAVLFLGYHRFVREHTATKKKSKARRRR